MPYVIVAALIALGLAWAFRRRVGFMAKPKNCRWVRLGGGPGSFEEYKCEVCGVTGYSRSGKPPRDCKRGLGGGGL